MYHRILIGLRITLQAYTGHYWTCRTLSHCRLHTPTQHLPPFCVGAAAISDAGLQGRATLVYGSGAQACSPV